jgi:hypothetical protein
MPIPYDTKLYEFDLAVQVERYLPLEIRTGIEENYYARIEAESLLERFAQDPTFLENPGLHLALYTDHGIVHARDVARQVLRVLDIANGLLMPRRAGGRQEFMRGYGVMLAYVHDIGMLDNTPFGREMHPEFATQEVFSTRFDGWMDTLWNENCGNIAWRLINLARERVLEQDPKLVLREMLAMANAHSKTKVPLATLNDPHELRRCMQLALGMDICALHLLQQVERARTKTFPSLQDEMHEATIKHLAGSLLTAQSRLQQGIGSPDLSNSPNIEAQARYGDFEKEAFGWLVSEQESVRALVKDVTDTLRTLRCADALRQRGTVLVTSGNYEILLDRMTANAVYVLKSQHGETFMVEADNIVCGEANIASSELTREGDLRFSFLRGTFPDDQITHRAAHNVALAINDIQADAIESFRTPPDDPVLSGLELKSEPEMQILLEGVEDNLQFVEVIRQELERIHPAAARRISIVPSLHSVSDRERMHYLNANPVHWDIPTRQQFVARMEERGHKTANIDLEKAFADVRLAHLPAGEILIEAGAPAGFVYVPLGEGLTGTPLGGYKRFFVETWAPLGSSGVIRGAPRNATIVAHNEVSVLIIPRETYLEYWYRTYSLSELTRRLAESVSGRSLPNASAEDSDFLQPTEKQSGG